MITPTALAGPTALPGAPAVLYTAPALSKVTITRGFLNNESALPATATLWLVRNGGARSAQNIILGASAGGLTVGGGPSEPYVISVLASLVLGPGDALHGESSVGGVLNFVISGWVQT